MVGSTALAGLAAAFRLCWRGMATKRTTERRQFTIVLVAWLAVGLALAVVLVMVVARGSTAQHAGRAAAVRRGDQTRPAAAALTRSEAAGWIARQVNSSANVACDPGMCSALEAAGLPVGRLVVLPLSAADPRGAGIVVATLAVRSQFGVRLSTVYAPEVIARFGSGPDRIEIRYVAPDGARSFEASLTADRGARVEAGRQLLRNHGIQLSGTASAALFAGSVDPRLMVTLAALAALQQVHVSAFGDSSPGAADIPLRAAEIGAGPLSAMRAIQSFVLAQRPPYLPTQTRLVRVSGDRYLLTVQFDAPSPLGLSSGP